MRLLVGVEWSDDAFEAVKAIPQLYRPTEIVLVHSVNLHPFESPILAPMMAKKAFDEFVEAMKKAGEQVLDQVTASLPSGWAPIRRVCEVGLPATVLLDAIETYQPDLVLMGAQGRNRLTELLLGSVSHHVLTHTNKSTVIIKRPLPSLKKVVAAIEGPDDAASVQHWLQRHPFHGPVDLRIVSVVPYAPNAFPNEMAYTGEWEKLGRETAQKTVDKMVTTLSGASYTLHGHVETGHPLSVLARESREADLLIVGSHGRHGLDRILLGSVSHAISHRAACSVLVVR
jgi:nucleotide-binding universal stress UspA family protein